MTTRDKCRLIEAGASLSMDGGLMMPLELLELADTAREFRHTVTFSNMECHNVNVLKKVAEVGADYVLFKM